MNVWNAVLERLIHKLLGGAGLEVEHENALGKELERQQIGVRMMALVNQCVLAVGRRRYSDNDARLANRRGAPIEMDELDLGSRVIVEDQLVLGTLEQILIRGAGRNAA